MSLLAAFAAAVFGAGFGVLRYYQNDPAFMEKTTLNGESIGGRTPGQVADLLADRYNTSKTKVILTENGKKAFSGTLEDFGYTCDRDSFEELLVKDYEAQRQSFPALVRTFINGTTITSEELYSFDDEALADMARSSRFREKRVETVDPAIALDEESGLYVVTEGSEGNMIDDSALKDAVQDELDIFVARGHLPAELEIPVPEDVYTSVPPLDNEGDLQTECNEKNRELRYNEALSVYDGCSVTYTFGNENEVLDHDTIISWLNVTEDPREEGETPEKVGGVPVLDYHFTVTLNEEAADNYVTSLKARYDTQYLARKFQTTTGKTITFPEGQNEYGYRINYAEECAQLKADIGSGQPVTREPVYYKTNDYGNPLYYKRNGKDDLCGTYVEVNLTKQHLWFYIDGNLIVESDIVSGKVDGGRETQTGVFPLAFKQSPRTLTGDEAGGSGSWSVTVKYWMPFYDGEGLHDAGWRGSFGGSVYVHSGSHGCVNLPPGAAEKIYKNIEVGVPIILYKE